MDLTNFQTYLSINVGSKATNNYFSQMKGFFVHFQEFNQESINSYLASKVGVWKNGSFNAFFRAVKWYMKFSKIVVELPKTKKEERKPRAYLEEKQMEEILSQVPVIFQDGQKAKMVLELLYMTGMRPDELYNLKRENINLQEVTVTLINTKTFKSRLVFIPKDLANEIQSYFNSEAEKENAFNLNERTLDYYCQTISKYMNIKVYPYMIRHSFAQMFKEKCKDMPSLAQTLGHTNLNTTMIYSDITDEKRKEQYQKLFNKKRRT